MLGGCSMLHSLRLYRTDGLTDASMAVLARACPQLRSLRLERQRLVAPLLESASLCEVHWIECEQLTSPQLHCTRLRTLHFTCTEQLHSPLVRSSSLRSLSMAYSRLLCKPTLDCAELTELDLTACQALPAAQAQRLLSGCPRLQTLRLSGCRAWGSRSTSPPPPARHACAHHDALSPHR
jgi:hypothetical protein